MNPVFNDELPILGSLANLADFLVDRSSCGAMLAGLLFGLFLTPAMMYALAFLAEGRVLYYRDQFRALVPGDVLLAVSFATFCQAASQYNNEAIYGASWVVAVAIAAGLAVVVIMNAFDIFNCIRYSGAAASRRYTKKQLLSPTKVYHNTVVYFIYTFMFVLVGVPSLICVFLHPKINAVLAVTTALISFSCWLALLIRDSVVPRCDTAHVEVKYRHWILGAPLILLAAGGLAYLVG